MLVMMISPYHHVSRRSKIRKINHVDDDDDHDNDDDDDHDGDYGDDHGSDHGDEQDVEEDECIFL